MRRILLLSTVALVVVALAAGRARASDYTVNTSADSGEGSLRAAIDAANGTPVGDRITFDPSLSNETIALSSDLPAITDTSGLTIDGGGDITVKGQGFLPNGEPFRLRVFQVGSGAKLTVNEIEVDWGFMPVNSGTLTASDSTFSRVTVWDEGSGSEVTLDKLTMTTAGRITASDSTLTVSDSTLSGSSVAVGSGSEAALDKLTMTESDTEFGDSPISLFGGALTVRDSTISENRISVFGGDSGLDGDGGAIYNEGGTLTVSGSTFFRNFVADNGGAIYNEGGTLTVSDSTFSQNESEPFSPDPDDFCPTCGGGGIYNSGTATVSNSTFFNNRSSLGDGILNHGTLTVMNSTLSGDELYNFTGLDYFGQLTVSDSTVGGLVNDPGASATLDNTIVAGGCDQFGDTVTDGGYNLDSGTHCGFSTDNSSVSGRDPKLALLADNGGPTGTRALLPGSPAINAVPEGVNGCGITVTTDQRGVKRPQGGACEIGSFEDRSPRVDRVAPADGATGIALRANVMAHISEEVIPNSINTNTVKLFRAGTNTPLAAQVSYDAEKRKAILDPDSDLQRGGRYRAVVSTGVRDLVGNRLDQNRSEAGNQRKVWFFTVRK